MQPWVTRLSSGVGDASRSARFPSAARRQRVHRDPWNRSPPTARVRHRTGVTANEAAGRRGAVVAGIALSASLATPGAEWSRSPTQTAPVLRRAACRHRRRPEPAPPPPEPRIALVVLAGDHPAGQLDHCFGHALVGRKFINGGNALFRRFLVLPLALAAPLHGQCQRQCGMEDAACRERRYEWDGSNAILGGRMPVAGEGHWFPIQRWINSKVRAISRAACDRPVPFQAAVRGLRSGPDAGWPAPTGWRTRHSGRALHLTSS